MKYIFRGCLALVVGVLMVGTALAAPIVTTISVPASNIGCVDTLQCASPAVESPMTGQFIIPAGVGEEGYYLSIYCKDTTASAASTKDTLTFVLCRRPDLGTATTNALNMLAVKAPITKYPRGWNKVYGFAAVSPANSTAFPIVKHIPLDSLAVYPIIPGNYCWVVYGGRTKEGHVPTKAYTFYGVVESGVKF